MAYTTKIIEGDEVRNISNTGYELISGKEKVSQDISMVLSTNIRKNGLGSELEDSIGTEAENPAFVHSNTPFMFDFQMKVRSAMVRLKNAQRKYQYSQRTPKELIHEFSHVRIWSIKDDPRNYKWQINIITIDGRSNFSVNGRMRW